MVTCFTFVGGDAGDWQVVTMAPVTGEPLARVAQVAVVTGRVDVLPLGAAWGLRGVTSHQRYVTRDEQERLTVLTPALGRRQATCAALIPIRKSAAWWAMTQDERRAVFEARSEHIRTGLEYLPAIARRLHHSRDLGEAFDFVTWFEYAPEEAGAFETLVRRLRDSEEWTYVEREMDIRLVRRFTP